MPRTSSPLRYPGGKTQLTSFVRNLLITNNIVEGTYIEPFAGGAGVAIQLLLDGDV
ncbi:TPA: DNA adenine methylase, partial [Enterococcus faecalis]|nr:DNA adenine methylase [Enterococcus faecalis]